MHVTAYLMKNGIILKLRTSSLREIYESFFFLIKIKLFVIEDSCI